MSTQELLRRFRALEIDHVAVGLRRESDGAPYFCTPVGAEVLGSLGVDGIHFVFIPGSSPELVFAVSPMPSGEHHVEPVAESFEVFLRLMLACGGAGPLEQISWRSRAQFDALLAEDRASEDRERTEALTRVRREFGLEPCPEPYDHVKSLQNSFDYTTISFSEEYYEVTGKAKPDGEYAAHTEEPLWVVEVRLRTETD